MENFSDLILFPLCLRSERIVGIKFDRFFSPISSQYREKGFLSASLFLPDTPIFVPYCLGIALEEAVTQQAPLSSFSTHPNKEVIFRAVPSCQDA
jgi:hypothetical protein